eukprot:178871-Pelagomonas_calceolata.AAC.1
MQVMREERLWGGGLCRETIQEFTNDLRHRLRAVWRDVDGVNPRDTFSKLATYPSLFAVPFDHNVRAPYPVYQGTRIWICLNMS